MLTELHKHPLSLTECLSDQPPCIVCYKVKAISYRCGDCKLAVCITCSASPDRQREYRSCTSLQHGKAYIEQAWWSCHTCKLVRKKNKGCCTYCALECHADHNIEFSGFSTAAYCDCGTEFGDKCKCLSREDEVEEKRISGQVKVVL